MAISLTKMTVPLATDQSATSQGLLMPKLQYRFRVSFLNFGVDNITCLLYTSQRPRHVEESRIPSSA